MASKNLKDQVEKDAASTSSVHRSILRKSLVLSGIVAHLLHSITTLSTSDRWLGSGAKDVVLSPSLHNATSIYLHAHDSTTTTSATTTTSEPTTAESRRRRDSPSFVNLSISGAFSTDPIYHDIRAPLVTDQIPLLELIQTGPEPTDCHSTDKMNMSIFHSIILNESITHPPNRNIPNIIHMTSKSRCLTERIHQNILTWQLPGYSIYFHDEAAVDRLMEKYFPAFPHLQVIKACSRSGAAKADIWRYLVLWEYGGMYTDIDNAPGEYFNNGTVIQDTDEAWFVVERIGVLSQYFMASSPKHPIMFVALTQCLSRLVSLVEHIGTQYVPYVSGPGVTKAAMMIFMKNETAFQTVQAGIYTGLDGRTVTVAGNRKQSNKWVQRESIKKKQQDYVAMNMTHFGASKNTKFKDSCYEYLYKLASQRPEPMEHE